MEYIATFFSHFGATRFERLWRRTGVEAKEMPVPRSLSSSCGTCVRYTAEKPWPDGAVRDEVEQIVIVRESGYEPVYRAEDL